MKSIVFPVMPTASPVASIVWLVACALVACGPVEDLSGEIQEHHGAITNSTLDPGHASVGMVIAGTISLCTGTLVGNKTVLTAAHCIPKGVPCTFIVNGKSYPVAKTTIHPKYAPPVLIHDVAVLQLASAPLVASSPVSASTPTVGLQVVLVGYGDTLPGANDSGKKRVTSNSIYYVGNNTLQTNKAGGSIGNICDGDGGAPFFATIAGKEAQISVGIGGLADCVSVSAGLRLDVLLPWIKTASGGDLDTGQGPPKDTSPPKVTITAPQQGSTVGKSITVRAQIIDNLGVTRAELFVDGQLRQTKLTAPYDFSINLTAGKHTLKVIGRDAAGNSGSAAVTVSAGASTGDSQAPVVVINYPSAGATVSPGFTLTSTISDNIGVNVAELMVDGALNASRNAPPFHFPVNLGAGPHTLRVVGRDAAGNVGEASVAVTVGQGGVNPPPGTVDPAAGGCSLALASGSGDLAGWMLALLPLAILRRLNRLVRQRRG